MQIPRQIARVTSFGLDFHQAASLIKEDLIPTNTLARNSLLLLIVLLVPILPFVLFGEQSEAWFQRHIIDRVGFGGLSAALAIVGALITDILLPVPSSAVMTFSGSVFGVSTATAINWIGLSCGSAVGYVLGRRFGVPILKKFSKESDTRATADWFTRFGPWMLAALRGLPVFAEASVLLAGVYRMPQRVFWPPVLLANFVLALIYAALGFSAKGEGWLGLAVLLSIVLPLVLLLLWLTAMRKRVADK